MLKLPTTVHLTGGEHDSKVGSCRLAGTFKFYQALPDELLEDDGWQLFSAESLHHFIKPVKAFFLLQDQLDELLLIILALVIMAKSRDSNHRSQQTTTKQLQNKQQITKNSDLEHT